MKPKKIAFLSTCLFFHNLFSGYHGWGLIRLGLIMTTGLALSMIWGAVLEREALAVLAERFKSALPVLDLLPTPLFLLLLTPFHWGSLRLFLIPIFTFMFALLLGARYLQDIYNLSSLKPCLRYLIACLFGFPYPTLKIGASEEGEKILDASYLPEIGGPGYLDIPSGYAVAVSRPQVTSNIYGEGMHFLERGEKVEEFADLNDQTDRIEAMSAFSYEGVAIQISDIHYGFRLKQSPPFEASRVSREAQKPSYFSTQALRNLMQSRVVTEQGLTDWRTMVKGMIRSTISDFIYRHTVTELLKPPTDYNPYADLKRTFQSRPIRERLRQMGTELLWINLGLFDLEKPAFKQELLKSWYPQDSLRAPTVSSQPDAFLPQSAPADRAQATLIEDLLTALAKSPPENLLENLRTVLSAHSSPSATAD